MGGSRVSGGGGAYVSGDAGEDDLLLARRLDGGAEVGVVPRVDFTVAVDEGGGGVHRQDLLHQRTVRA